MIWQNFVILALALIAALWLMIAHGVAYQRTKIFRRLLQSGSYLIMVIIAGWFVLKLVFDPSYKSVSISSFLILLFASTSQVAVLWFANDKYPRYRHSRDLLLLRQPQPVSEIVPDPAQGLYVPHAPLGRLSLSLPQKLGIVALVVWMALIGVVLWLV